MIQCLCLVGMCFWYVMGQVQLDQVVYFYQVLIKIFEWKNYGYQIYYLIIYFRRKIVDFVKRVLKIDSKE